MDTSSLREHLPPLQAMIFDSAGAGVVKSEVYNPERLRYFGRVEAVVSLIRKEFPRAQDVRIGDFGCGWGLASCVLAELGYGMLAVDVDKNVIETQREKFKAHDIEWIVSTIEDVEVPDETLDAAIAVEVLEHCVYPEAIVEKIFRTVKPGGILIVTTPNGSRLGARTLLGLPSYTKVKAMQSRGHLEAKQFGAVEHLLRFKARELRSLTPADGQMIEHGYFGVSGVLFNKYTYYLMRLLPANRLFALAHALPRVRFLNAKTASKVYAVYKKNVRRPASQRPAGQGIQ